MFDSIQEVKPLTPGLARIFYSVYAFAGLIGLTMNFHPTRAATAGIDVQPSSYVCSCELVAEGFMEGVYWREIPTSPYHADSSVSDI